MKRQMNVRLDDLTIETIKAIGREYNMSESQVITRAVMTLDRTLRKVKRKEQRP